MVTTQQLPERLNWWYKGLADEEGTCTVGKKGVTGRKERIGIEYFPISVQKYNILKGMAEWE